VFNVTGTNGAVHTVISGLAITNGYGIRGGGVMNNHATLTLTNCVLTGNRQNGIYNDGSGAAGVATLYLNACTLNGNFSAGLGGGIFNYGVGGEADISATACTFSANVANTNQIYNVGGAVCNDGNGGLATLGLFLCTLSGNAAGQGGAIWNTGANGTGVLSVAECTFSGNWAFIGGAIYNNNFRRGQRFGATQRYDFEGRRLGRKHR
jgi:hypothetical protein